MDENLPGPAVRWQALQVRGLGPIERVVAVFGIGPPLECLPFASFKVKVVERKQGGFCAVPNVAILAADGTPDWIGGLGKSVDEALADCLAYFLRSLDDRATASLCEADFKWADPSEF